MADTVLSVRDIVIYDRNDPHYKIAIDVSHSRTSNPVFDGLILWH